MTKKTTQVRIRTVQRTLVQPVRLRCQQCGAEVRIVTTENAAGILQTDPNAIDRLIESGRLHAVKQDSPEKMICGSSLSAASTSEPITSIEGDGQ